MSIRLKILLACLVLVGITSALGGFAYVQERELGSLATGIYDNALVGVSYAQKARTDFVRLASSAQAGRPISKPLLQTFMQELGVAREQAITPSGRAFAAHIQAEVPKLLGSAPSAALQNNLALLDAELGDLAAKYMADSFIYRVRTDRAIAQTRTWDEVTLVVAILLALICATFLELSIVPPIRHAVSIASAVAAGDLRNEIRPGKGRSETSRLLRALAAMQEALAESTKRAEALRISEAARLTAEYETDAARRANKAKSEFLATMSHELRTPLNAILGFSEMIRKQMMGPVPKAYVGYAEDINASGRHLLALINDVLDISKLEAGKFQLHPRPVALDQLMADCVGLMRNQAEEASIHLVQLPTAPVPVVEADERLMKQIVLNLLSNAIKFTPAGGKVSVTFFPSVDNQVIFLISDTGIGMSAREIEVALTPFGQIDSKVARQREGTGLGLSIARSLVELHKGSLRIQSRPGAGTTVSVAIPISQAVAKAA